MYFQVEFQIFQISYVIHKYAEFYLYISYSSLFQYARILHAKRESFCTIGKNNSLF